MTTSEPMAVSASIPQGAVQIESGMNSKLVLDVDESGRIIQQVRNEGIPTQSWRLIPVAGLGSNYRIARSGNEDLVLTVRSARELAVLPMLSSDVANQWLLRPVSDTFFQLENRGPANEVLSVAPASDQPGITVMLWTNSNGWNQQWRLASLRPSLPRGPEWANIPRLGGLVGGVPLCDWRPIRSQIGERANVPIFLELYRDPLIRPGPLMKNARIRLDQSNADFLTPPIFYEGSGRSTADRVNATVSAAIVRPGPDFDPSYLYKVTLFSGIDFRTAMLPLAIGVYPDFRRLAFDNSARSVLFEEGRAGDFTDDYTAALPYYQAILPSW